MSTLANGLDFLKEKNFPPVCKICDADQSPYLPEEYADGLPLQIVCDNCGDKLKAQNLDKKHATRRNSYLQSVPLKYRKYLNIGGLLSTQHWYREGKSWCLVMFGNSGSGKTTKAYSALLNVYVGCGVRGTFITSSDLCSELRSDAMSRFDEKMSFYSSSPFLIVDDLLNEVNDPKNKSLLESLFTKRELEGRKTVITTNASGENIFTPANGFSARMESRFNGAQFLDVNGPDLRANNQ